MNLHVNLVGVGAGFTYATDGPTHQGMQDMQAMMVLPGISVYNVTDDVNSTKLAILGYNQKGPKYFRIEKGLLPRVYNKEDCIDAGLKQLKYGSNGVIISTGYMTKIALQISEEFELGVVDLFRVKPINENGLTQILKKSKTVITLEECTTSGGIGEKVAFIAAKNKLWCDFLPISVEDQHCHSYGNREMLQKKYKIDKESVGLKIKNFLERK